MFTRVGCMTHFGILLARNAGVCEASWRMWTGWGARGEQREQGPAAGRELDTVQMVPTTAFSPADESAPKPPLHCLKEFLAATPGCLHPTGRRMGTSCQTSLMLVSRPTSPLAAGGLGCHSRPAPPHRQLPGALPFVTSLMLVCPPFTRPGCRRLGPPLTASLTSQTTAWRAYCAALLITLAPHTHPGCRRLGLPLTASPTL